MDSPSAMMMKPAQRSAMWPPSTTQSATCGRAVFRNPEPHRRRDIFDCQRHRPEHQPRMAFRKAARDPEDRRHRQPGRDADRIHARQGSGRRCRDPQKDRLADLHRRIGDREPQSPGFEGLRDRGREHEPAEHQQEQQDPDRRRFGIEPVGDPGGVDPHPPDRQEQQGRLQRAERGEAAEQACGKPA